MNQAVNCLTSFHLDILALNSSLALHDMVCPPLHPSILNLVKTRECMDRLEQPEKIHLEVLTCQNNM